MSSFKGCKNGVSKQLLENWCPYALQVRYYGQRFNLVVIKLSDLEVVFEIENLVKVVHAYFCLESKEV